MPFFGRKQTHVAICIALIIFTSYIHFSRKIQNYDISKQYQTHAATQTTHHQTGVVAPPGTYRGQSWNSPDGRTISIHTLGETKFAKCDVHSVLTEDGKNLIDDWIFMEEVNAINVAVLTEHNQFIVFEQYKYAIPGKSLSIVGGMMEVGETPFEAARREVLEEMGLGSKRTLIDMRRPGGGGREGTNRRHRILQSSDVGNDIPFSTLQEAMDNYKHIPKQTIRKEEFHDIPQVDHGMGNTNYDLLLGDVPENEREHWYFLGRYRTAANRGGGFTYTYLLQNATPLVQNGGTKQYISQGDDEQQQVLFLSVDDMKRSLLEGKFQEVKWTATMALSLLTLGI